LITQDTKFIPVNRKTRDLLLEVYRKTAMTDEQPYYNKPQEIEATPITVKHILLIYKVSLKILQMYNTF
jgi:hypothetical protein